MTRYIPDFRWQIDWADDGYAHTLSDVTADIESYGVSFGSAYRRRSIVAAPARGQIRLRNRDGLYSTDGTSALAAVLEGEHAIRRYDASDNVTLWSGLARPVRVDGVPVGGVCEWELTSATEEHLRGQRDVNLSEHATAGAAAVAVASESGVTLTSTHAAPIATAVASGSAYDVLRDITRHAQGALTERHDNSLSLADLFELPAATDLPISHGPIDPTNVSRTQALLRNTAEWNSTTISDSGTTLGIVGDAFTLQANTPRILTFTLPIPANQVLVGLGRINIKHAPSGSPVVGAVVRVISQTLRSLTLEFTAPNAGSYNVDVQRYTGTVETALVTNSAVPASVDRWGAEDWQSLPWWPEAGAGLVRYGSRPLEAFSAPLAVTMVSYSEWQPTQALWRTLRDNATAGRHVTVGTAPDGVVEQRSGIVVRCAMAFTGRLPIRTIELLEVPDLPVAPVLPATWYALDDAGNELWRINPDNPSDTSGDYGLVGAFPSGLSKPKGIAYGDDRWLVIDGSRELWRINPANTLDTAGFFGSVGDMPSGVGSVQGIAYGDSRWLIVDDGGDELWRINPDDPDDTSGDFGLVGSFPSGLTQPAGIGYGDGRWYVVDNSGDELWRINPDNPSDTSGDFGLVGSFPSGLTNPQGIAYGDSRWLVADFAGDELWRINPDNPSDTSGDFGLVGSFPSGLTEPLGLGAG